MGLALISYHVAGVDHKARLAGVGDIGFDLLNCCTLMYIFQNLLVYAFDTGDDQMAAGLFHQAHSFIVQIHTGIAQPADLFVEALLDHHAADFGNALFVDRKCVILKHDLFHAGKILYDVLDLADHILWAAQPVTVAVERLGVDTEVALCGAAAAGKNLYGGKSGGRKHIISHAKSALDEFCGVGYLI